MSKTFSIDTHELEAYGNRLEAAVGQISLEARQVTMRAAAQVVAHAKRIVPVDTGYLRSSIGFTKTGEAARSGAVIQGVEATAPYAGFVEFGTSRMAAQPFLRPALAAVRKQFRSDMEKAAKRAVTGRTAGGRAAASSGKLKGAVTPGVGSTFSLKQQLDSGAYG